MSKFAKLFERNGNQVVVMATQTGDGFPCIHFIMDIGGAVAEPKFEYKEGAWDKRDAGFDLVDEDAAFSLRDSLAAQYGDLL